MIAESAITRTADRFSRAASRRSTYHYVVGKLRRDPCTRAIGELGPLGDVIDLGCGRGHLAIYLLERNAALRVRAFDWDSEKVALARRAGEGLAATFETEDVRHALGAAADTVLLIDVLHYLPASEQDALLDRALDLVRPGGRLVVRDASAGFGVRSLVTWIVEWVATKARLNLGGSPSFRDWPGEIRPKIEARGMPCSVVPCWAGTPFSNVLVVMTKPR